MAPQAQPSTWERHFQTGMLAIITTAIVWFASSVATLREDMARIQERLAQVTTDLSKATGAIETLASNAATKADHSRDMTVVDAKLIDHEQRLRRIEQVQRSR